MVATQWLGVVYACYTIEWIAVKMTLGSGQQVQGVMAYGGGSGSAASLFRLSCDVTHLSGYPTPSPTAPPPPVSYISCYKFGIVQLGVDKTNVNLRLATNPGLIKSIAVGQAVRLIGYQTDPFIQQQVIGSIVPGGTVQSPPSVDILPANPPKIRTVGFALIEWDDNDPSTLTKWWWIIGTVVKSTPDCSTVAATPTPAAALPTVTDIYAPIYTQQAPLYPTVDTSINPSGENPPALIGSRGIHIGNADTQGLNVDTIALNAEQCVDGGICDNTALYDPNVPIAVYAPVTGCAVSKGSVAPSMDASTVIITEFKPGDRCGQNAPPILQISFTHLDQTTIQQWKSARLVHRGDIVGYLCPQNNTANCNLGDEPIHLALGLSSWNRGVTTPATMDELLGLLPRLHDCYPKSLINGATPIPANYIHSDLCHVFFHN